MNDIQPSSKGFSRFLGMLAICLAMTYLAVMLPTSTPFEEDHISVLNVVGTISPDDGYTYNQQYLLDAIDDIANDRHNKGMLLYVDSPGGYVYDCDELYLKLLDYKYETGRPIYVSMGSYAASAAYYISCTADKIYANRNTLTGSIGVISGQHIDLSGFLKRYDITVTEIASGPNKTMGNYFEPMTEEQKAIMQGICNEYFDRFVNVIIKGRNLQESEVRTLADGRLYTANQAVDNGLIDGIATYEEALSIFARKLKVDPNATVYYTYEAPNNFINTLLEAKKELTTASSPELQLIEQLSEHTRNGFMYYCQP